MQPLLVLPFIVVSVFFLLRAETARPRDIARVRIWKPAATLLVIAMALLSLLVRQQPVYTLLVVVALGLCLLGDVFLIDGDKPLSFMRGLICFWFGHAVLIGAFTLAQNVRGYMPELTRELAVAIVLIVLVGLVYVYMRDSLGPLRQPVLLYMAVIALMVHRAASGSELSAGLTTQSALAAGGAVMFLVSDLILALSRFMFPTDDGKDAVWVLGTYYVAISMLALSCAAP
jgi:uncharacterized membrane protein YhhN